jgi:CHASE1-domain containing sensor protein
MVPFALGGTALWAVIGLVLLLFRDSLARQHRTDWLWICLAGFGFGLVGLAVMIRHDANRRRRRAQP